MPKKYADVRAASLAAGWEPVQQRGSHEVWGKRKEPRRIVVAGKDSATRPNGNAV